MKVYRKHIKKITVDDNTFLYTILEQQEFVKLRCYSTKTSYLEVIFDWILLHDINLYRPKIVSLFIEYAIKRGWSYTDSKQIYKISADDSAQIIKELGIDLMPYL